MFTTLICLAILIAMAMLLYSVLHEDSISVKKRNITEMIDSDKRRELIKKDQSANNYTISRLEKILAAIKKAFNRKEPEPDYDQRVKALVLLWLAWLGILIDTFVQWAINVRIGYFSSMVWLVISFAIALAITWFTELAVYALTDDPARPERAIRICRMGSVVTGIVSLGALGLFLFARTAAAPALNDFVVSLISGSLWIIAEGLGICCGFIAAWSRHLSRKWRASKHYHAVEQKLQIHQEFKQWLDERAGELEEAKTPASKSSPAQQLPEPLDVIPESSAKTEKTLGKFPLPATDKAEGGTDHV